MPVFKFAPNDPLTPEQFYSKLNPTLDNDAFHETLSRGLDRSVKQHDEIPEELKNQFVVFQIKPSETGQTICEASMQEPLFKGDPEQPDMHMTLELQSFHLADCEPVNRNTRATMRLVIGKDKNSSNRLLDDVFWTISAGLDFYNRLKDERAKPEEYQADFTKAFGGRPIEIPGGLANMTFEVIKHREPTWWKKTFGFLTSEAGKALTSVIGFPGVTQSAIHLLDEVFNRFDRSTTEPIFESRSMILALSHKAKMDYTMGNPRIRMGCINPGFCILARGRDFHTIADANAYYYPHYGMLVPSDVDPGDVVSGNYHDPFKDITYVVFKVNMAPTRLELRFNYGANYV